MRQRSKIRYFTTVLLEGCTHFTKNIVGRGTKENCLSQDLKVVVGLLQVRELDGLLQ